MRITILGAGGVGGYFGARLAQGGCDKLASSPGERTWPRCVITDCGWIANSGEIHLEKVRVSDDPVALGPADYVFVCVKLWDTEAALARRRGDYRARNHGHFVSERRAQGWDLLRRIVGEKRGGRWGWLHRTRRSAAPE